MPRTFRGLLRYRRDVVLRWLESSAIRGRIRKPAGGARYRAELEETARHGHILHTRLRSLRDTARMRPIAGPSGLRPGNVSRRVGTMHNQSRFATYTPPRGNSGTKPNPAASLLLCGQCEPPARLFPVACIHNSAKYK